MLFTFPFKVTFMYSFLRSSRRAKAPLAVMLLWCAASSAFAAEPVPFRRAIDMALKHSGTIAIASADQMRAGAAVSEARSAFIPSVFLGSGLGYQIGVPLSVAGNAPSLFNVNTQQFVLNFSQMDSLRATRLELQASTLDADDKRSEVILQCALLYTELDATMAKLRTMREQVQSAQHAQYISSERRKEGLDSDIDMKRAQLVAARAQLRIAEAEGNADVLRERLGKLIGMAPAEIDTVTESIPTTPDVNQQENLAARAIEHSPFVMAVDSRAQAADFRARAIDRNKYPSIDFATQYARLASFNNYDEFYRKFTKNNYTFGASIRVPFFNSANRAQTNQAKSDVIKAHRQAEEVRNNLSAETLKLQRGVRQLAAAREVARLEYELAQAGIEATQAKIEAGNATARDLENARIDTADRYTAFLDANFELYRAQMQLMRMTGDLKDWATK